MSIKGLSKALRAFERKYLAIPKERWKQVVILEGLWIWRWPVGIIGFGWACYGAAQLLWMVNVMLINWRR